MIDLSEVFDIHILKVSSEQIQAFAVSLYGRLGVSSGSQLMFILGYGYDGVQSLTPPCSPAKTSQFRDFLLITDT